ncbi:hypothetical protein SESBI_36527 [Sesbania bispinosa]|nr:hypothetical protein SESBI_36527 [Sesbania bispinosa]
MFLALILYQSQPLSGEHGVPRDDILGGRFVKQMACGSDSDSVSVEGSLPP